MRRLWVLCLVACGDPQDQVAPPATAPPLGVSIAAAPTEPVQFGAPVAPEVAKPASPVQLWSARPGLPIAAVFATADGSAVVSIDEANHARLWPSLDAKREPWVLPLTVPKQVALQREGDGFAVAALDDSGGLELLAISGTGELTSHAKRPPEPGYDAVVPAREGFIVLRRDQTLELFDSRGQARTSLAPLAGEHVVKLLHRNGETLALLRAKDGMHARVLAQLQPAPDDPRKVQLLGWSTTRFDVPKLDVSRVFVSPDFKKLVSFDTTRFEAIVVDLRSGKKRPFASPNSMDYPANGVPIGFAGDGRIVFGMSDFELTTLEWWTAGEFRNAVLGGSNYALDSVTVDHAIVTDRHVIAFAGHELALATANNARSPSEVRFLGYRTARAKALKTSPLGAIATIGRVANLLDDRVHVEMRVPALDTIPFAKDLALIRFTPQDGGEPVLHVSSGIDPEWLENPNAKPKENHSTPRIALFDLAAKRELQRWPTARAIRFEPSTQLMAIDRGNKVMFARFDAAARKFVDERTVTANVTDVVLLDPVLAGGDVAMLVRARGESVETRTVRDVAAELPEPMRLTGRFEAVDRAGRVYLRADADTIVVHGRGSEARITGMTGWKLRPSPTGTQVAAFAKHRLMLLDERGQPVWTVGFPGVTDAAWTPDGALVVLAGDLAKVDLATGRVVAAQCGWGFALRSHHPEIVDFPSTTETLCDR